jgi:hypothetical protein
VAGGATVVRTGAHDRSLFWAGTTFTSSLRVAAVSVAVRRRTYDPAAVKLVLVTAAAGS